MRKLSKTREWMGLTAQMVLITPVMAGLAWIIAPALNFGFDDKPNPWSESSNPTTIFSIFNSDDAEIQPAAGNHGLARSAASQVTRTDGVCHTAHRIRNVGAEPIDRVSIMLDLLGNSGAALGTVASASKIVNLKPGEQREVAFQFKCPPNIGQAVARVPKQKAGSREVILIQSSGPGNSSTDGRAVPELFSKLVVPLEGVDICQSTNTCILDVLIDDKFTIAAKFQRDPKSKTEITSNDKTLISHLAFNKKASIKQVQKGKIVLIPLTQENLLRKPQGYFSRLWAWISDDRGSHAD